MTCLARSLVLRKGQLLALGLSSRPDRSPELSQTNVQDSFSSWLPLALAGRYILWTLRSQKGPIQACHLTDDKIRLQMVSRSFGIFSLFPFACKRKNTHTSMCAQTRSGRTNKDGISGCCRGGQWAFWGLQGSC